MSDCRCVREVPIGNFGRQSQSNQNFQRCTHVILPAPTEIGAQMANPQAITAIKQYFQQDNVEIAYLGQGINLNYFDQKVGQYHAGMTDFSVELQSNYIVWIDNRSGVGVTGTGKQYTPQELEQMARQLIASLAPHVNLASLDPKPVSKSDGKTIVYFFF